MQVSTSSTHRYTAFGRGAVVLEASNGRPLDLPTIAARCPAVLAEDAHSSRSDKYTFISTLKVLQALATEGFHPHSIMQGGTKFEDKRGYTKHMVRLRQNSAVGRSGTVYEICLLGSHDGTTTWQAFGGFFRAICKNGTIWFDEGAVKIAIPHKGNIIPQVIDAAHRVLGQSQNAYGSIDNLRSIRGGLSYVTNQTLADGTTRPIHRHTAPVRSVDGDVRLNRALWTLAEEMAKIKSRAA